MLSLWLSSSYTDHTAVPIDVMSSEYRLLSTILIACPLVSHKAIGILSHDLIKWPNLIDSLYEWELHRGGFVLNSTDLFDWQEPLEDNLGLLALCVVSESSLVLIVAWLESVLWPWTLWVFPVKLPKWDRAEPCWEPPRMLPLNFTVVQFWKQ